MLSIIIPAHNEENYLDAGLTSVVAQRFDGPLECLIMANACTDRTVDIALSYKSAFAAKGWKLRVLRTRQGGKLSALNCADKLAQGDRRVYLDADIVCSPTLMAEIYDLLDTDKALYATGTLVMALAKTWVTRHYANLWRQLPFMKGNAPGAGVFAVNAAGRKRWGEFPDIISDDTFVRLNFAPEERKQVSASYQWPLVEGFANLVKVRRRQDAGVKQLHALHPEIFVNEDKDSPDTLRLFLRSPVSFLVYVAVSLTVKFGGKQSGWERGR